jgi:glycosyltransferase involved in cell wall biosynthesis
MHYQIHKVENIATEKPIFSILIPSWNNLPYLQACIASIKKNSHFNHQIIVVINEGKDGTLEWVNSQGYDYVHAIKNIGICYGLNVARSLVKANYILYINDDMYAMPNWDLPLYKEAESIGHPYFMLSGTMVEHTVTGNSCVQIADFGKDLDTFREKELLTAMPRLYKADWAGASWPPNLLHVDLWDMIGGMSIEYSPGMYSDPDLSMKCYWVGVRIFKGVGTSLVYHFGSKSTRKLKKPNSGRKLFLAKWGISANTFYKKVLQMGEDYKPAREVNIKNLSGTFLNYLKRIKNQF